MCKKKIDQNERLTENRRKSCYLCDDENHIIRDSPKKNKNNIDENTGNDGATLKKVSGISQNGSRGEANLKLEVGGKMTKTLLDTSSDRNILPFSIVRGSVIAPNRT